MGREMQNAFEEGAFEEGVDYRELTTEALESVQPNREFLVRVGHHQFTLGFHQESDSVSMNGDEYTALLFDRKHLINLLTELEKTE